MLSVRRFFLHDERAVRCAQQTIRAGDHIEAISRFHLPAYGVMTNKQIP